MAKPTNLRHTLGHDAATGSNGRRFREPADWPTSVASLAAKRAAVVFAICDHALGFSINKPVVRDAPCQPLVVGICAQPARHRPAHEHATGLKPQIIEEPISILVLDDKAVASYGRSVPAGGFDDFRKIAPGIVLRQRNGAVQAMPVALAGAHALHFFDTT